MFLPVRVVYVLRRRYAKTGEVLHNDRDMGQSLYEKITKEIREIPREVESQPNTP